MGQDAVEPDGLTRRDAIRGALAVGAGSLLSLSGCAPTAQAPTNDGSRSSTPATATASASGIPTSVKIGTLGKTVMYRHITETYDPAKLPKTSMNGEPSDIPFFKPKRDEGVISRDYPSYDSKTFKFLALPAGWIPPQDYYMIQKDGGSLNAALKSSGYKAVDIIDSGHVKILPNLYLGYYDFAWLPLCIMTEYWTGHESMNPELWRAGNDYVVIAGSFNGGATLIAPPDVSSIHDLDGSTVGIMNPSFDVEAHLNQKLKSVGLATEAAGGTVRIVMGAPGIVMNSLMGKKIQATFAWTLFEKDLRRQFGYRNLVKWQDMGYGTKKPSQVLIVRRDILEKHPEIVQTVVRLNHEATQQALKVGDHKEPDAARYAHYWTYYMGRPTAGASKNLLLADSTVNATYLKDVYDYMVACGYFKVPYKFDELVDLSFQRNLVG